MTDYINVCDKFVFVVKMYVISENIEWSMKDFLDSQENV